MIVYGGDPQGCTPSSYDDVWILEHANGLGGTPTWMHVSPTGTTPGARHDPVVAYDEANNRMIIFAGYPNNSELWVLVNADGVGGTPQWTQLSPTGGPPPGKSLQAWAYDPASNRLTVFGGWVCCSAPYNNEVWVLTHANGLDGSPEWTRMNPDGTPPAPRYGVQAGYDVAANKMILFGGSTTTGTSNDVWILTHANGLGGTPVWQPLSLPEPQPLPRGGSVSEPGTFYDQASRSLVIFGGYPSTGPTNDTWILANAAGDGSVVWTSSDTNVATIAANGLAMPNGQGNTSITVCKGGVCGSTWLYVTNMPPTVAEPPMNRSVALGAEVTWCATVNGSQPMTFQWQLNGTNLAGANAGCLTVSSANPANAGLYSLILANPFGTNTVQAALSLVDLKMFAGLVIVGPPGGYRIEAQDDMGGTNTWTILGTNRVTEQQMPFYYFDTNSPSHPQRFYRSFWMP
jgi:hypothetical protein